MMNDEANSIISTTRQSTLGNRIRNLTHQLRQESEVQIQATSRILGAAAKLAENHDRLIDEVVEMVEQDLDQEIQVSQALYTVEQVKQQFDKLSDAKAHFKVKVSSWAGLVEKLNEPLSGSRSTVKSDSNLASDSVSQRLEAIEQEIQILRTDMKQVLSLFNLMAEKLL